jgi:hypothetical protein
MTARRRAELKAARQQAVLIDEQKALEGAIVDGVRQIQAAFTKASAITEAAPEVQSAIVGKGKKTKQRG